MRDEGWAEGRSACSALVVLTALVLLPGCRQVGAAVSNVLGGGGPGVVDAHTVYRIRPGCATLAARTTAHGYSVLTPQAGGPYEAAGIFEGPAREGESIFRYVPPTTGASWEMARESEASFEAPVRVEAFDVSLPDVRTWLDRFCGALPPGEGEPGEALPRVPPRVGS